MLDTKFIRENPDIVKWACKVKGFEDHTDAIIKLDKKVRELKTLTESKTAEKNKITKQIPTAAAKDKTALIAESKKIGDEIAGALEELDEKEKELNELLLSVPQIPTKDTPLGKDETENVVTRQVGNPKKFDFTPRPHWELLDMNKWWVGDKIAEVALIPQKAVSLFLEGVLTMEHFKKATETENDIVIPGVTIGDRTLTARIVADLEYEIYTADADGNFIP